MSDIRTVLEKFDLLLAELAELRSRGPYFRIRHRFSAHSGRCLPGEEVLSVSLVHRNQEHWLPLSLSLRILFDYLARHSRFPQSASQIEAGIRFDPFSMQHAINSRKSKELLRSIPRSYIRVYIMRTRLALQTAFASAGLHIDPASVLASERTTMNETGYRLKAAVDWVHAAHSDHQNRSRSVSCQSTPRQHR